MEHQQINLIDTEDLLVTVILRHSDTVTLCFTGIGHAIGGVDVQSFEFLKSSQNSTTIFIVDRKRSWGNNIDFDEFKAAIDKYIDGKKVNAIGNSMGGFLAILVSKFISIRSCVAFVPQYSVNKHIVPNENRFDEYTNSIACWKYESLLDSFNGSTAYYIFFGADNGIEDVHRKLMPLQSNVSLFVFSDPKWAHSVAQNLKEHQLLYPVIKSCFDLLSPSEIVSNNFTGLGVTLK